MLSFGLVSVAEGSCVLSQVARNGTSDLGEVKRT